MRERRDTRGFLDALGGFLDDVVYAFSPSRGARRKAYRTADRVYRHYLLSSYRGAGKNRLRSHWTCH